MATMHHTPVPAVEDVVLEPEVVRSSAARKALAALRIGFGLTFLWAFFDKLLALGFHTGWTTNPETGAESLDRFGDAAWINGGSPTEGFLMFGVAEDNPFKDFFNSMAGDAWADWLFMIGLLGIGLALTFGFGMRIAAATGALLYMLMYAASLPLENNPVVDDHLLGAISVIVLALTLSGDTWGAGKAWAKTHLVRKYPALR
jgi:thiosulfate dehydrogenase [quinone] large subunit